MTEDEQAGMGCLLMLGVIFVSIGVGLLAGAAYGWLLAGAALLLIWLAYATVKILLGILE